MKDPAFLFYSKDFLTGVSDLTMEERGQYITLLCLQHQKGRLSGKAVALAVGNAAADVMAKFKQDSDGLFYNERLEIEAQKRAKHSEKQRQRAIDGWQKRKENKEIKPKTKKNTTANAAALPLVNVDVNVNEDVNNKEGVVFPFDSENFKELWNHWKEYKKKEFKFKYASVQSEQASLTELANISKGLENIAVAIIHQSMANGWKGFFDLKPNQKNGTKTQFSRDAAEERWNSY